MSSRDDQLYGPLWDPGVVERDAKRVIERWERTHLAAKSRHDQLAAPLSPAVTKAAGGAFEWQPKHQLPLLCLVVAPPAVTQRTRTTHDGTLELEVAVYVEATKVAEARHKAMRLAAAYASCLIAHPGETASAVRWLRDADELLSLADASNRRVAGYARVLEVSFTAGPAGQGASAPDPNPTSPPAGAPVATGADFTATPTQPEDTETP